MLGNLLLQITFVLWAVGMEHANELPHQPVNVSVELHPTDVRGVIVHWSPGYDGNTYALTAIQHPVRRGEPRQCSFTTTGTGQTGTVLDWMPYDLDIGPTNRSATVTHLRPASFYQFRVFASNIVGEGDPSVPKPVPALEMPQQPPSAPPREFFGTPASNTSINLFWLPPLEDKWNGPLIGYSIMHKLVCYRNNTFQTVNVTTSSVNTRRYELSGLAFFQGYEITIAAFNAEGVGVFSNLITVMTLEGHPTAPPHTFHLTAADSTSIRATWYPPNQQFINGINQGYKLEVRQSNATRTEFLHLVPQDQANTTGQQSTHITGLRKFTEYSITVVCYTSQGDGPRTPVENVTTLEDVPGQVGQLSFIDIRDTSLKVVWTPPTEINGILQSYTLMYEKKNETSTRQQLTLGRTNLTYTIYSLNPTTWYTISVHASTVVGPGPDRSASIQSGVPPELPEPPFNLGVTDALERSARVQFLPGYDGRTSITLWIVQAWEGDDPTEWKYIYSISAPDDTAIVVQNLQPFTRYRLRILAENIVGKSTPSEPTRFFQTRQAAPGVPPGNVTVHALNATALQVSWTPLARKDWNGDPLGYRIYYKMQSAASDFLVMDLVNGMNMDSAILGPLEEWIVYDVKMIAYNDAGMSNFSPVTVERTRESVPSSGPVNVHAVAVSSTSVNVTWGEVPLFDRNGMIQGFKVQYRSSEENIAANFMTVDGNTSSRVHIAKLRRFVQYEIGVLAYTRMGDGVLSLPEIMVKTKDDGTLPGPPVIIWFPEVTYTTAKVIWNPPLEPNGIITGYMVSYRRLDSQDAYTNSSVIAPTERRHEVTGLQRQVHYEFRVTARTNHGWGETASVEVFTMVNRSIPDSPGKPSIMSTHVQARTVTISWTPGQFNGYGPLRNFTVQYRSGDQLLWVGLGQAIPPHVTTYTVTGLRPNSRYMFRVAATNDIGTSSFSVQSDEVNTLDDCPEGAPRYVTVKPLTTTSVRVSWEQPLPSTWNGEISGYVIRYRQVELDTYQEDKVLFTVASTTLYSLIKFVNYEFLVIAFNGIGEGPASTPVTVFVGEAAPTAPPVNIQTHAPNSTEIFVSWDPPPPDTQNGALSGYKVSYWLATDGESIAKQIIVLEQQALLQNLHVYSNYAITLQAYNLAGEGPPSNIKHQQTKEALPERPASLSFWNITYVSIDVSWEPPVNPNGIILSYELSYREGSLNGGSKVVTVNVAGVVNYLHVGGLGEKGYQFSVRARTSVGQGLKISRNITTGPQAGSPGRPLRLRVEKNDQDQQLIFLWENGEEGTTPIYAYIIQYLAKDTWQKILELTGQRIQAEISYLKLNPDTEYMFRIVAMNSIGISPYSDPSHTVRTPAPDRCQPGSRRVLSSNWNSVTCAACAADTYQPEYDQAACEPCTDGMITMGTAKTHHSQCVAECGPGWGYVYVPSPSCQQCKTKWHNNNRGSDPNLCKMCSAGWTSVATGQTSCDIKTEAPVEVAYITLSVEMVFDVQTDCAPATLINIQQSIQEIMRKGFAKTSVNQYRNLCSQSSCTNIVILTIDPGTCLSKRRRKRATPSVQVITEFRNIPDVVTQGSTTLPSDSLVVQIIENNRLEFSSPSDGPIQFNTVNTGEVTTVPVCGSGDFLSGDACAFCEENRNYCNYRGTCEETGHETARCLCNSGYSGTQCESRSDSDSDTTLILALSIGCGGGLLLLILVAVGIFKYMSSNKKSDGT